MASVESYSKWPESKVPTTVIWRMRGNTPAGVTWPLGAIRVTGSPGITPKLRASSTPKTTPNSPGTKRAKVSAMAGLAKSVTDGSSAGSMPRTNTPFMSSPRASKAWAETKGATPTTSGCWRAAAKVAGKSGMPKPSGSNTSMCESTLSMRSRTSF